MNRPNHVLHSSLLSGTLSIKVVDVDIHRTVDSNDVLANISPIETDYIFCISNQKSSSSSGNENSTEATIETFYCSKRYLDVRNLAYALHSYAVEVVKYHQANNKQSTSKKLRASHLLKLLEKPIELLQYTTNTESNYSDLAGELDDVLKHSHSNNNDSQRMKRRTSKLLNDTAPLHVRDVLEAVDEFYECILSEKRQFGLKSNFASVEKVAERRRQLMNGAFENFISNLSRANVNSGELPVVLDELIGGFESFLVTDVIIDPDLSSSSAAQMATTSREVVVQPNAQATTMENTVSPKSTRRRASVEDRKREHEELRSSARGLIDQSDSQCDDDIRKYRQVVDRRENEQVILLPQDETTFAILFGIGVMGFKYVQDYTVTIQFDVLVLMIIACILIGHHLRAPNYVSEKDVMDGAKTSHHVKFNSGNLSNGRPLLNKTTGAYNLIQASFRRLSTQIMAPKEQTKVALKTLERFPDGAELGSEVNCWSIPPSCNFHVRGDNYLNDNKKVPSDDYLLPCRGCDLFLTDNPPTNIGRYASILSGHSRDVPTFIINYRLPWGVYITYHEIPEKFLPFIRRNYGYGDTSTPLPQLSEMTAGERALCNFFLMDEDEKNAVWKIVPVVVEGPWVVKRVVGEYVLAM
eukprot:scaffold56662_cov49-Cyclotella_meneghiniana.AAC.2